MPWIVGGMARKMETKLEKAQYPVIKEGTFLNPLIYIFLV